MPGSFDPFCVEWRASQGPGAAPVMWELPGLVSPPNRGCLTWTSHSGGGRLAAPSQPSATALQPQRASPAHSSPSPQPGQVVGVDVEWRPSFGTGGRPQASVMQLAVEGRVFLMDLPVLSRPAGGQVSKAFSRLVSRLLSDPSVTKLGEQSPCPLRGRVLGQGPGPFLGCLSHRRPSLQVMGWRGTFGAWVLPARPWRTWRSSCGAAWTCCGCTGRSARGGQGGPPFSAEPPAQPCPAPAGGLHHGLAGVCMPG